jgi:hypothetical protein
MARFSYVVTAAPGGPAGHELAVPPNHCRGSRKHILLLGLMTLACPRLLSASDCIPIQQASQHVGETKCVAGKVLKIRIGNKEFIFWTSARINWPALSRWWSSNPD